MTSTERTDVGTAEDLHASATRSTGLDDFGIADYSEALAVLLDSYGRDAELTPLGSRMSRYLLRGALVARLFSEQAWKQNPGYEEIAIERPIFVTGLPRTGTTALHRLLTVDPAHQGLEMWLTEVPQPRPERDTWESNPVFAHIETGFEQHHVEHPEFMGVHYMSAGEVEECWQLLRQSVQSIAYECLAYLPTYSSWLAEQSWLAPYTRHRRNLQLIGMNDVGRRWVLKNPSHLFALDELLQVYPDALIIQTHREPRTILPSMCSLAEQATAGWSTKFTGRTIGETQLDLWERGLHEFSTARSRASASQFCDVDYHDFVADPVGTVAEVYRYFGLSLTEEARSAMESMHSSSRTGARRPSHKYSLADFGLDGEEVERKLARRGFGRPPASE